VAPLVCSGERQRLRRELDSLPTDAGEHHLALLHRDPHGSCADGALTVPEPAANVHMSVRITAFTLDIPGRSGSSLPDSNVRSLFWGYEVAWDFSTEPGFQELLDWADDFVREEVEPLDILFFHHAYRPVEQPLRSIVDDLKAQVRARNLWACHLGPGLGGQGYGQLKLALLNEILGRSIWAPIVFGCQAPDTGNAEIIAHYGTEEQKEAYLQPLLNGEVFSCYSMTEPHGGSDPTQFRTCAVRDGDEWVISGEKFFSSNLEVAAFVIVMALTDPDAHPYEGMSMFLVPADTPGIEILQTIGLTGEPLGTGMHAHVRYNGVRVPSENLLGGEGKAFEIAQRRLGGGRIHHAMRTVATARHQFDMMAERAVSRFTQGGLLAEKQLVQDAIADSWIEIQQFRLLVLHTAWLIDQSSTREARTQIAACKVVAAQLSYDLSKRATHLHGALGVSNLMPLGGSAAEMGIMDGPTEVHKVSVARRVLKGYQPSPDLWPTEFLPRQILRSRRHFDDVASTRLEDDALRSSLAELLQSTPGDDASVKRYAELLEVTGGNL
jgi:acyl-CoA dehydrogenase